MAARRIYLDYNATTPVDSRVLEQMLPYFSERFGNSASRQHVYGWEAKDAVDRARAQVGALLGVDASEIVFTSGATEAVNLAIKGVYHTYKAKGNHIISVQTEHSAVLDCLKQLEQEGADVTLLNVDADGRLDPDQLARSITTHTILVSIMLANNETGAIHDIAPIADLCTRHRIFLMSDATQAVGKLIVEPRHMGIHLLTLSGHKLYGPKGIGALYVSRRAPHIRLAPQMNGGNHESGLRAGTLNVPGIVGLGAACALASLHMADDAERLSLLRNRLEDKLTSNITGIRINCRAVPRLPNVTHLSFRHSDVAALMAKVPHIAMSAGSACASGNHAPSHVLTAMGLTADLARNSLRISLGRATTTEEIEEAGDQISAYAAQLTQDPQRK